MRRAKIVRPDEPGVAGTRVAFIVAALFLNITSPVATSEAMRQQSNKDIWGYLGPSGCPAEYYQGVREVRKKGRIAGHQENFYAPGDELLLECIDSASFVYPTRVRTCQADGTWSGAPPLCIPLNSWDSTKEAAQHTHECPTSRNCDATGASDWATVGELHGACSYSTAKAHDSLHEEQRRVLFTFSRSVHLSFVTISLPERVQQSAQRTFNIAVKARRRDVSRISSMSESRAFLQRQYEMYTRNKTDVSAECAATRIGVYTRQILVEYPIALDEPSLITDFYVVVDGQGRGSSSDCTRPPVVPDADLLLSHDNRTASIACHSDYEILNPIDETDSLGVLTCSPGHGWDPYPFPVCCRPVKVFDSSKHVNAQHTSDATFEYFQKNKELTSSSVTESSVTTGASSGLPSYFPSSRENNRLGQLDIITRSHLAEDAAATTLISRHRLSITALVLIALGSIFSFVIVHFLTRHLTAARRIRSGGNNDYMLPRVITVDLVAAERPSSGYHETEPMYASVSELDYDDVILYDFPPPSLMSCYGPCEQEMMLSDGEFADLARTTQTIIATNHITAPLGKTLIATPSNTRVMATKKCRSNTF